MINDKFGEWRPQEIGPTATMKVSGFGIYFTTSFLPLWM